MKAFLIRETLEFKRSKIKFYDDYYSKYGKELSDKEVEERKKKSKPVYIDFENGEDAINFLIHSEETELFTGETKEKIKNILKPVIYKGIKIPHIYEINDDVFWFEEGSFYPTMHLKK